MDIWMDDVCVCVCVCVIEGSLFIQNPPRHSQIVSLMEILLFLPAR